MQVGDIYHMQWGWEQTNNSFFRVVALRGKTQALIQEVKLAIKNVANQSFMAEDREYDPSRYEVKTTSVWFDNNDKGHVVKKRQERWDGRDQEVFRLDGHICTKYNGEQLYESWYA